MPPRQLLGDRLHVLPAHGIAAENGVVTPSRQLVFRPMPHPEKQSAAEIRELPGSLRAQDALDRSFYYVICRH
jgi:hypothetical protein